MYPFKRNLANKLAQRLAEFPRSIQIIEGPRQTGKTVLVRQVCNELEGNLEKVIHFFAVDAPRDLGRLAGNEFARNEIMAAPEKPDIDWLVYRWQKARFEANKQENQKKGCILVLDEIQKIPKWSDAVKGLWDEDRALGINLHVVLLGSSPLLMQQGLTESLTGRYELLSNTHWSYTEMAEAHDFNFDEYIYFGGYPGSAALIREETRWLDYVRNGLIEPNIEKDILMMTRVDKPALLKNAFELGCEYSGQIFSYNSMLGQLNDAGNTTTLAHYMHLLEKAGLMKALQQYSGNKKRRRASKPKLNVMNTALMSCFSGYSFEQAKADRTFWGRLVESAVGAHLINTSCSDLNVFYWRERGIEVDFVLSDGQKLLAIEVKSGKWKGFIKGFEKFTGKYNNAGTLLIGGEGISIQEFLSYPATYWLNNVS